MDENLSEKEQIELIKQWWRDYGWYLIGGIAVAALGYYGIDQYRDAQRVAAERAHALYTELAAAVADDRPQIDEILAQLRDEHPSSPYTDQAGLLIAQHYLVEDSARAAAALRDVVAGTDDPDLAWIARLRLARVLAYRDEHDQALAALDAGDPGEFAAQASDVRGDIHFARGETELARAAYLEALTGPGSASIDRNYVQMKLNDLPRAAPAEAAPAEGER